MERVSKDAPDQVLKRSVQKKLRNEMNRIENNKSKRTSVNEKVGKVKCTREKDEGRDETDIVKER